MSEKPSRYVVGSVVNLSSDPAKRKGHADVMDATSGLSEARRAAQYPTVYLSGPMAGCVDEERLGWRQTFKAMWPGDVIDPTDTDRRGREDELFVEIVHDDKNSIDRSGAVLCYPWKPSVGTSMEVIYAWEHGKPVITVWPGSFAQHGPLSPWIRYHSTRVAVSLLAARDILLTYRRAEPALWRVR